MSITLYFKIELVYSNDKYEFEVTEIQADLFKLYLEKSNMMELNTIYSMPNEQTWIYIKHEESVEVCVSIKEKLELDEENRRKKNLLLLKAKNMLINYESQKVNDKLTKLIEMQYKLKQEYNKIK